MCKPSRWLSRRAKAGTSTAIWGQEEPTLQIFDPTPCDLGEGPMWHPEAQAFFWFDILGQKLFRKTGGLLTHWDFDAPVSAAGWVDANHLLVASATALMRFDIRDGTRQVVAPLEADNPTTRSNDGRADPFGGFWIGTTGLNAERGAGAIYRYYRGEVRRLFAGISIPNAICFPADGTIAYFADSMLGKIMKVTLDGAGWPSGTPAVFVDLGTGGPAPDGAIVDRDGFVWNAQWGASRVARYAPDGQVDQVIDLPTAHVTCPAFGGADLGDLLITTARQGLGQTALASQPTAGQTFLARPGVPGRAEHRVIL